MLLKAGDLLMARRRIVDILDKLQPSGPDGFEGLVAKLLRNLTGRRYYLARSGAQAGSDLSSDSSLGNVIAVECKRYGAKTALRERELLGELAQATRSLADLDLWVLVATRDVSSQLEIALAGAARERGVGVEIVSAGDGSPSSLEVLCAQASEIVVQHVEPEVSKDAKDELARALEDIALSPGFGESLERLRQRFSSCAIGYDDWRVRQNSWLMHRFSSKEESRAAFNQLLNVRGEGISLVERTAAWSNLDDWLSSWGKTHARFCLLGEEGDGKTWAIASWLAQRIQVDRNFPPTVFLPSHAAEHSTPKTLLCAAIERQLGSSHEKTWDKRLDRWMNRTRSDAPAMLLVLDGINERRSPGWWRELLEGLAAEPWGDRVAVLITCRVAYWNESLANLRHLNTCYWTLTPYDDRELDDALAGHSLTRRDISKSLMPLIRKPRYLDLAVKYRASMEESGDVTAARLIYVDWKDRLERKNNVNLSDEAFRDLICDLARKASDGADCIRETEVEAMLPSRVEKADTLEELRTGGILRGAGSRYVVDERMLTMGLGLLLADEVKSEARLQRQDLIETIAQWLEPQADMDIKARICGSAALHALSTPEYLLDVRVALLHAWIGSHNPGTEAEESLPAYFPLAPDSYFRLSEILWSDAGDNPWGQELMMRTFLRWGRHEVFQPVLKDAFEHWLGFVHPHGFPSQRGTEEEAMGRISREIADRVGFDIKLGEFAFAGYSLYAVEDNGLLRLGRAALAVISHLPRQPFLRAIVTGCIAEAVMGYAGKHALFAWTLASSHESLWTEVERAAQELLAYDHIVTKRVAYRLLSFEGSEHAVRLMQTLPREQLFPDSPLEKRCKEDPCVSWFPWTRDDCEMCARRTDLPPSWLAKRLNPFCTDPDLSVPGDLGARIVPLVEAIDADSVWSSLWVTSEDHASDEIEPALCVCAPDALATLVDRVACRVAGREGLPLRQLVLRLIEHHLILDQEARRHLYRAWQRLHDRRGGLSDDDQLSEAFLFSFVLQDLDQPEQLRHLLGRPGDALDLVSFERLFRPIEDWASVRDHLQTLSDPVSLRRVLWMVSAHAGSIPENLWPTLLPLVDYEDTRVRRRALRILYSTGYAPAIQTFVEGAWRWDPEHCVEENHWGSVVLSEREDTLTCSELRKRIHPMYLGYAVELRGSTAAELSQYAEDINRTWELIAAKAPSAPPDLPGIEVAGSARWNIEDVPLIGLQHDRYSGSARFVSRDASWGGVSGLGSEGMEGLLSFCGDDHDERCKIDRQIAEETMKQQTESGNHWFARRFWPCALQGVVRERPDLVSRWLQPVLAEQAETERLLTLGRSFYEALCEVLLSCDPRAGVDLYLQLRNTPCPVRFEDRDTGIRFLDYALFSAPQSYEVLGAWQCKLEACRTDRELMDLSIAAKAGGAEDWLWSIVEEGVDSSVPLRRLRSFGLLGFIEAERARAVLEKYRQGHRDTWLGQVIETSVRRLQSDEHAKHWFRRFLDATDTVDSWRSFRLFLRCADRRFWCWREITENQASSYSQVQLRRRFLDQNMDKLRNAIGRNERDLETSFLGQKVLDGEMWPWM